MSVFRSQQTLAARSNSLIPATFKAFRGAHSLSGRLVFASGSICVLAACKCGGPLILMEDLRILGAKMKALETRLGEFERESGSLRRELAGLAAELRILQAREAAEGARPGPPGLPPPMDAGQRSSPRPQPPAAAPASAPPAALSPAVVSAVRPAVPRPPSEPGLLSQVIDASMKKLRDRIGEIPVEEFVGMNLLNKIGILILVLGASFFLKIAYDWITPAMKVLLLTAASAVVLLAGDFFYRRRNYVVFGLGLISGGMVMLFFTAYASYNYEATRIIPENLRYAGTAIQVILCALMIANSLRYNRESMTSFAYSLAFLCVSINETGEFSHFSLIVLGLLALSLMAVITIKRWKYLTGLGILATYANFLFYSLSLPRGADGYVIRDESNVFFFSLVYLSVYWAVFHVSVFTMHSAARDQERTAVIVNLANATAFLGFVTWIRPAPTVWGGLIIFGTLGLIYTASALAARMTGRTGVWQSSIVIGSSLIALGLGLRFSGPSLVLVWLIQATIMILTGYLFREVYLRYLGYAALLLKIGALLSLPPGDAIFSGDAAGSFELELNRGSVYLGLIGSAFAVQAVARREEKTMADQIAWHLLGSLLVLSFLLLSYYAIQTPHQALLLVPAAILLMVSWRVLAVPDHVAYSLVLLGSACIASIMLLFLGPAYKSAVNPLWAVLALFAGAAFAFAFLVSSLQAQDVRAKVRDMGSPLYMGATFALAIALVCVISLVVSYGHPRAAALLLLAPAVLLLWLDRTVSHGKLHFLGLCLFAFLFSIGQFMAAQDSGESARITFLVNGSAFWILALVPAWLAASVRKGTPVFWILYGVSSTEALMLLYQITHPAFLPSAIQAYALCLLIAALLLRGPVLAGAILSGLAFLAGPAREVFYFRDLTGWMEQADLLIVCILLAASAAAVWRLKEAVSGFLYYTAFAAVFFAVYALLPLEFHAVLFSSLTVLAFLLHRARPGPGSSEAGRIFALISAVSFVYLLVKMNLHRGLQAEWLKALLGFAPLLLLSLALRLDTESRPPAAATGVRPPDLFRSTMLPGLFLLFVALTMTLIDTKYWSVAWAAEGTALVFFGLIWRIGTLRYAGMVLIAIMLAKVAFSDLGNLEDTLRVLVLVGIGLLLVGASFLYARFKDRLMGAEPEQAPAGEKKQ